MSSWLRSSLRLPRQDEDQDHDLVGQQQPVVLAETFERHWHQLRSITTHNATVPTCDDVVAVLNLLDQMTTLLHMELSVVDDDALEFGRLDSGGDSSEPVSLGVTPCLDILLSENVLAHVLAASRMPIPSEQQDQLRAQQLKLYETLLEQSSLRARSLLSHQPFLKPLLHLLSEFAVSDIADETYETDSHLVMLLNQLCSRLMDKDNVHLLDVFFNAGKEEDEEDHFLIFSILVRFLHSQGQVGGQARDALLLCMALSKEHDGIGKYIAKSTNFCPVLATGLSGLYSLMPRRLEGPVFSEPSWYRLSKTDVSELPEVESFLSSLEFCDAVIQVAHPKVRQHLLGLIYMGFLVPVLGPALTQSVEAELVCSTAYVELFLRRITEPSLLAVFLRFIFTDTCDNRNIVDTLTDRLGLQSQLCIVTLSLFETLIGLNCEDVMLWLIFRHLIPMTCLLPSQRATIRQPDLHGRAAEKLLSLVPICCLEARNASLLNISGNHHASPGALSLPSFLVGLGRPSSEDGLPVDTAVGLGGDISGSSCNSSIDYHAYLMDARSAVRHRHEATQSWQYDYDGVNPPPDSIVTSVNNSNNNSANNSKSQDDLCSDNKMTAKINNNNDDTTSSSTGPASSGYQSLPQSSALAAANLVTSTPIESGSGSGNNSGPVSLTEEEDREFWSLMRGDDNNQRLHAAIKRIQQMDDLSLSSGGNLSWNGSQDELSPRDRRDDIDNSVSSLGRFLDLLLEKIELMPSNNLATNLLVTSVLSQLASYPQPLLRAVLIHPDIVLQPSVRGLFTAIASLRQKLDNIMPTLPGAEEAMLVARKYLCERMTDTKRRDSNVSVMSATITHLGQEARATRNSLSAAFSSMFRTKKTSSNSGTASAASSTDVTATNSPLNSSAGIDGHFSPSGHRGSASYRSLSREVRQHALAAVLLEEWLQELAAIAQEQSVLQKENAFHVGMGIDNMAKGDTGYKVVNNASFAGAISPDKPVLLEGNETQS